MKRLLSVGILFFISIFYVPEIMCNVIINLFNLLK
jgi:hypothetical protein